MFPNLLQGWLRKHEEKSKYLKTRQFPLRYVQFEKTSKSLKIWYYKDKSGCVLKEEILDQIEYVKYLKPLTNQDLIFTDG